MLDESNAFIQLTLNCVKSILEILEKAVRNMLKVNNENTRGVFIVNFAYISHLFLMFLLLTTVSNVSTGKCLLGNVIILIKEKLINL